MTIRVLIVDDSRFFQRRVKEMLSADPSINIVGFADNGQDAIQKAKELQPDVITMDIEMPVMDGITAVKKILLERPVPIVMFSSLTTQGAKATFDALDAGAVDYMAKNFDDIANDRESAKIQLCKKIVAVSKTSIAKLSIHPVINNPVIKKTVSATNNNSIKIVAIGTSTGGPMALQQILQTLPENFPVPIILVQHMPGSFTPAFAKRLDGLSKIHIKEAENGDLLTPATAYLAPGGCQMIITKGGAISIKKYDESKSYNPCVDTTFLSVNEIYPGETLAIILTGMGCDGSKGSKKLKESGCEIWAQDEESCVVFGMPGAVIEQGIADDVIALGKIAEHLVRKLH